MIANRLVFKCILNAYKEYLEGIHDGSIDSTKISREDYILDRFFITKDELNKILKLNNIWGEWAKCSPWDFIMKYWSWKTTNSQMIYNHHKIFELNEDIV